MRAPSRATDRRPQHTVTRARQDWAPGVGPARLQAFGNDPDDPGSLRAVTSASNNTKGDEDPVELVVAGLGRRVRLPDGLDGDQGPLGSVDDVPGWERLLSAEPDHVPGDQRCESVTAHTSPDSGLGGAQNDDLIVQHRCAGSHVRRSAPCPAQDWRHAPNDGRRRCAGPREPSIRACGRSRPNRRPAARAVSAAEGFGPASDTSTILICYDGSARRSSRSSMRAGCCPGTECCPQGTGALRQVWLRADLPARRRTTSQIGCERQSDEAAEGVQLAKAVGLDAVALTTNGMVEGIWRSIPSGPASAARTSSSSALAGSRVCEPSLDGSVSKRLVEHARRPVLVVPDEPAQAAARERNAITSSARGRRAPTSLQERRT